MPITTNIAVSRIENIHLLVDPTFCFWGMFDRVYEQVYYEN